MFTVSKWNKYGLSWCVLILFCVSVDAQYFGLNNTNSFNQSNDGSGSGLDADLLDGLNSSAFATGTPLYAYTETDPTFTNGSVVATKMGVNSVGQNEIINNSIISSKIVDGTIIDADIATNGNISASKISGAFSDNQYPNAMRKNSFPAENKITTFLVNQYRTNSNTRRWISGAVDLTAAAAAVARVNVMYGSTVPANNLFSINIGGTATTSSENFYFAVPPNAVYCFTNVSSGVGASATMNTNVYREWQE